MIKIQTAIKQIKLQNDYLTPCAIYFLLSSAQAINPVIIPVIAKIKAITLSPLRLFTLKGYQCL
jgi:hypothetical protein